MDLLARHEEFEIRLPFLTFAHFRLIPKVI
jgi:hypothetical protein